MSENKIEEKNNLLDVINLKRLLKIFIIILLSSFFIEILFFNFRSIQSLGNQEVYYGLDGYTIDGFKDFGDGFYKLEEGEEAGYIFLNYLPEKVNNLYIDFELPLAIDMADASTQVCPYYIMLIDANSSLYSDIAGKVGVPGIINSAFTYLNPSGEVEGLAIRFEPETTNAIKINSICVNAKKPIEFSFTRFLTVLVILSLIVLFSPKSVLWSIDCRDDKVWKKYVWPLILIVLTVLSFKLVSENKSLIINNFYNDIQPYHDLAESLHAGQVSCLEIPSDKLISMENPYSYDDRVAEEVNFKFDTAYYNGKYYVYFGILPCIIFYLPVFSLTGMHMSNGLVIVILSLLWGLALHSLLKKIIITYYPNTSFAMLLIMSSLMYFGCQLPYSVNSPDIYYIPTLSSMILIAFAISCWISARKNTENGYKKLSLPYVLVGSLCMALILLCRPHMIMYALVAIPLFWDYFKVDQEYTVKKRNISVGLALVPFILIGTIAMYYNYIRFGSVAEFGSIYNLTVRDIRQISFSFDKVVAGVYEYLFAPANISYRFPFVNLTETPSPYVGNSISYTEPMLGGLLSNNLILLLGLSLVILWKKFAQKKIMAFQVVLFAASLFLLVFDSFNGGVVYRYLADFSFVYFIIAGISMMQIYEMIGSDEGKRIFIIIILILAILSLSYNISLYFTTNWKNPLVEGNTQLYYKIFYGHNCW